MRPIDDKIKALIEQRIIESSKKQIAQKLISIAKNLGKQIISQSTINSNLDNPYYDEDMIYEPSNIPIQDPEDWYSTDHGFYFDGLQCGINLCITVMVYDGKVDELKATYNGYLVYAESGGELRAYAPFPAWEESVNMFYDGAVQAEKKKLKEAKEIRKEEIHHKVNKFWSTFRRLWGY